MKHAPRDPGAAVIPSRCLPPPPTRRCTILFLGDVVKPESTERIDTMDFYMDLVDELNAVITVENWAQL